MGMALMGMWQEEQQPARRLCLLVRQVSLAKVEDRKVQRGR